MLAELQSRFRDALVSGDDSQMASLIAGGRAAATRLKIHRRHYEVSLVAALLGKFPATHWLVGTDILSEAARQFVRRHPPRAPCIAEYGGDFPSFLADCPLGDRLPYLRSFVELEWLVGHTSVAIELPAVGIASLASKDSAALLAVVLGIQPGARYLQARWPVDELLNLYLCETAPDQFTLDPADILVEVRGGRGEFRVGRLDSGDFAFRQAVASGHSVGAAAEMVLERHDAFDIGAAFARLFAEGLVTSVNDAAEQLR